MMIAGATPKRRNGLAWRSARGLRAGQSGNGVSREAGRASCLHGENKSRITDHTGGPRSEAAGELSARDRQETESNSEVSDAERNAKAREKGRGSLSISIVAIESRETIPRKPVSSKGGYRDCGPDVSNTYETQRS